MVEVRDAKPHVDSPGTAAERETHQAGEYERSDDRGYNRGAIAQPLAKVLKANQERVSHMKSVAQCASRHPQEDVFEIRLHHVHTFGDRARVEERREHRGQTIGAVIGEHVKMVVLHRR